MVPESVWGQCLYTSGRSRLRPVGEHAGMETKCKHLLLPTHENCSAERVRDLFGWVIDLNQKLIRLSTKRLWKVWLGLGEASRTEKLSGCELQMMLGQFMFSTTAKTSAGPWSSR